MVALRPRFSGNCVRFNPDARQVCEGMAVMIRLRDQTGDHAREHIAASRHRQCGHAMFAHPGSMPICDNRARALQNDDHAKPLRQ